MLCLAFIAVGIELYSLIPLLFLTLTLPTKSNIDDRDYSSRQDDDDSSLLLCAGLHRCQGLRHSTQEISTKCLQDKASL